MSQAIQNFASVARLLALARRRNLCEWTKAFRAGATFNALQELNAAGEISLAQFKLLDSWVFWGHEKSKVRRGGGWTAVPKPTPAAVRRKSKPQMFVTKTVSAKASHTQRKPKSRAS